MDPLRQNDFKAIPCESLPVRPPAHTPNGFTQPAGRALGRVVPEARKASPYRRAGAGILIKGN
jgi:hypothetical protein